MGARQVTSPTGATLVVADQATSSPVAPHYSPINSAAISIAVSAGAIDTTSIFAVDVAEFGDYVIPSVDGDLSGMTMSGYVSDVNEVTVTFYNGTGGLVNLACNLYMAVVKAF